MKRANLHSTILEDNIYDIAEDKVYLTLIRQLNDIILHTFSYIYVISKT